MRKTQTAHFWPVLYELHWLPFEDQIRFKVLVLTFKCLPSRPGTQVSLKPPLLVHPPEELCTQLKGTCWWSLAWELTGYPQPEQDRLVPWPRPVGTICWVTSVSFGTYYNLRPVRQRCPIRHLFEGNNSIHLAGTPHPVPICRAVVQLESDHHLFKLYDPILDLMYLYFNCCLVFMYNF